MKFKLYTLIDITSTGARRGDTPKLVKQQQNYLTVVQTIGIRSNPEIDQPPRMIPMNLNKLNFGSNFKGIKNVWSLEFTFGLNQSHTIEFLESDFNFVPVIGELEENTKPEDWVFRTTDPQHKNLYFSLISENNV